eukprot:gene2149-2853_t
MLEAPETLDSKLSRSFMPSDCKLFDWKADIAVASERQKQLTIAKDFVEKENTRLSKPLEDPFSLVSASFGLPSAFLTAPQAAHSGQQYLDLWKSSMNSQQSCTSENVEPSLSNITGSRSALRTTNGSPEARTPASRPEQVRLKAALTVLKSVSTMLDAPSDGETMHQSGEAHHTR